MKNTDLLNSLNWRYATKQFDNTKKVSDNDFNTLLECIRLSASSYGLQPWKFIVIQNKDVREKLMEISWGQKQIMDCSYFIVFTALKNITTEYIDKYILDIANKRNVETSSLDGFKTMMNNNLVGIKDVNWSAKQAYIALGTLLSSAAILNIDTCPMEGLDPKKYDEILGLTEYETVCACAIGYRSINDKNADNKKIRFNTEDIFSFIK